MDQPTSRVNVCVRVRPLLGVEKELNEVSAWRLENQTITQEKFSSASQASRKTRNSSDQQQIPSNSYSFDHLFTPEHSNECLYRETVHSIVKKSMEGFHGSVFSYGQTSSGKTFTMNGTKQQPGIIPLSIFECFELVNHFADREYLFRISYLEVYNEQVRDLLNSEPTAIKIQHDPKSGIVTLVGVKEQVVMSPQQVLSLLQGGEAHRYSY